MKSFSDMQSTAGNLFSAYAQLAAYKMLFRSIINDVIPASVMTYIWSLLSRFFTKPLTEKTTIVVEEHAGGGMSRNVVYESVEMYLGTKASSNTDRFKVSKISKQKSLFITMEKDQLITDIFRDEIELKWRFVAIKEENKQHEKRFYELRFSKEHREVVVEEYLPFVLKTADELRNSDKAVKLFSMNGNAWTSVNLDHPTTFEKLAMEPEMKKGLISDLERFVRRKDFYRQVGKAWKRGYLLYGPPGTGKSSLIAAMANYLKFDVYDMELTSLYSDSQLKKIMLTTTNRSIIVIEDIDCSVQTHDRRIPRYKSESSDTKLTLSGLLNFIDGLWSCCGDERIIIFTTNHKDKLDPALLRPGRMDMHIHLSYCTPAGFRTLAFNYLGINREHNEILFDEIEGLIESCEVTPAVIAEELMRSEDADAALEGVKTLLTQKVAEKNAAAAATAEVKDGEKDDEEEEGYDDDDEEDFENALRMLGPAFRRRFARGWKGSGRGNF